jgi:AcrR family transcriptional regulator
MNAKATRQKILDAAQRLVESGGSLRLTTSEIARAAGCAEGTLFKHFKRKEDLCLALVVENAPKFKEAIAQIRPGTRSVVRNLEEIALGAIAFSQKLIPLGATLLADAGLLLRHRRTMHKGDGRGPREVFNLLATYIEGEQKLGRVDPRVQPFSVAVLIFGPCFHWAFVRQIVGRSMATMTDHQFVRGIVTTLMEGLSPTCRTRPTRPLNRRAPR